MTEANDALPSLRERQGQRVREDLRNAFVKLVVDRGVHAFTLHDVAAEAGVSDRTLYRYYPNREALIDDVRSQDVIEVAQHERGIHDQGGLIDIDNPEALAAVWEVFDEHADLARAALLLRHSGIADPGHEARTERLRELIIDGGVDAPALDAMVAIVRTLTGSDGWNHMTSAEFGLTTREAGLAAQWAVQVLIAAAGEQSGPLQPATGDAA